MSIIMMTMFIKLPAGGPVAEHPGWVRGSVAGPSQGASASYIQVSSMTLNNLIIKMIFYHPYDYHIMITQGGWDCEGGAAWSGKGAQEATSCWGAGRWSWWSCGWCVFLNHDYDDLLMKINIVMLPISMGFITKWRNNRPCEIHSLQAELVGVGDGRKLSCLSPIGGNQDFWSQNWSS